MKTLKRIGIGLGLLLVLFLGWGLVEPYLLDVEETEVALPGLPEAWQGRRVGQISDWQLGMWMDNERTVREAVAHLVAARPAFVLLSGDFVYHAGADPAALLGQVTDLARPLPAAGIPTFAVLGNHDYALRRRGGRPDTLLATQVAAALRAAGVVVLQNEARAVPPQGAGGESLYVVGVGAHWPGLDRPAEAVAALPAGAPRVVVMHNPDSFAALPAGSAPLAVAGHTHGGQIRIPFTPDWSYLTFARDDAVHADGWVEEGYGAPGNRLYVNRGIGFSGVPLRFLCRPELTLFTLKAQR